MKPIYILFLLIIFIVSLYSKKYDDVLILTVATENNDALKRFIQSADVFGYTTQVLGLNMGLRGVDMANGPGGGFKVNFLRNALDVYKDRDDLLIAFVDSYDVVFLHEKKVLLSEYENIGSKVVFSAEVTCWPQSELAVLYPNTSVDEYRFLNSGGIIGPASYLYKIVNLHSINDKDDDQLYYTQIFLDKDLRETLDIKLDSTSRIFQTLNGALDDVEIQYDDTTGYLVNKKHGTKPIIVHSNGPTKIIFNSLNNYLGHSWTPNRGCQHCEDSNNILLNDHTDYPDIVLAIFIEYATPFLDRFFERLAKLSYPKSKMHLVGYISSNASFQNDIIQNFNTTHGYEYVSALWFDNNYSDNEARKKALEYCLGIENCKFIFSVDGIAHLTYPNVIERLISMNKSMIAPLLTIKGKIWSNFWGSINRNGYYERSNDYLDIVLRNIKGIWNVPLVRNAYLLSRQVILKIIDFQLTEESDMAIPKMARENNIFMFVDNREEFGYLTNPDNSTTEHLHNDMWEIFDNPSDWEERYINPEYFKLLSKPDLKMQDVEQPCSDVFWFPFLSELFCKQLIEEVENFGIWSDGSNTDSRLEGGYENVPTRDIHMRQVHFEEHWIHVLQKYVYPIQKIIFEGYDDIPRARMNFIVRYRPDEQPSLRPHADSSSYSINIALNRPGIDYQGGGIKYIRQNCSIINSKLGWALANPGRVTHLHEGLITTKGTRYIFVTFINP